MKVYELIETLKLLPQDTEVVSLWPYGDRVGHVVASPVEDVLVRNVGWSEQHQALVYFDHPEDNEDQRVCLMEEGLVE